jgi:hypothetical protein
MFQTQRCNKFNGLLGGVVSFLSNSTESFDIDAERSKSRGSYESSKDTDPCCIIGKVNIP